MAAPVEDRGAIAFAEKLLALLDEGRFTATYKFAVLLGLMDLCLEHTTSTGAAPVSVTTRDLAEKLVSLYWTHVTPFPGQAGAITLRQNAGTQAAIVSAVAQFRARHAPDRATTPGQARTAAPAEYERLVRGLEWTLVEMPLPRLQVIGETATPFIYRIGWDTSVRIRDLRRDDFDNRICLLDDAGDHLVRLAGLLRPLIQRQWAAMVARLNRQAVHDAHLEEFLFGAERIALDRVREPLRDLQANRCFYCETTMVARAEVDHFLPWARWPDNSIENLVVAHDACNGAKRDFLAAAQHVERWVARLDMNAHAQLVDVAERRRWDHDSARSLNVARAVYLRLPGDAKLWMKGREFVNAERKALVIALAAGP